MGCSRQAVGGQSVGSRWAVGRRQPRQAAGGGVGGGGTTAGERIQISPFRSLPSQPIFQFRLATRAFRSGLTSRFQA